jgi:hypothetical protein
VAGESRNVDQHGVTSGRPFRLRIAGFCFLCMAFFVLCTFLLLSIIFVVLDIPHGYDATSLRTLIGPIYRSVFVPTISFFAEIFKSLFNLNNEEILNGSGPVPTISLISCFDLELSVIQDRGR